MSERISRHQVLSKNAHLSLRPSSAGVAKSTFHLPIDKLRQSHDGVDGEFAINEEVGKGNCGTSGISLQSLRPSSAPRVAKSAQNWREQNGDSCASDELRQTEGALHEEVEKGNDTAQPPPPLCVTPLPVVLKSPRHVAYIAVNRRYECFTNPAHKHAREHTHVASFSFSFSLSLSFPFSLFLLCVCMCGSHTHTHTCCISVSLSLSLSLLCTNTHTHTHTHTSVNMQEQKEIEAKIFMYALYSRDNLALSSR
jgi:hypothetical protein